MQVNINIPHKLADIFTGPARYRVAYGGRGSAKSWSFARMLLIKALEGKHRILCARELQNSIKDSVHKLLTDQVYAMGLQNYYEVGESFIRSKTGSDFIFKGLRSNTAEIKSMENISIAWVEEAQAVSEKSWDLLIPTIRAPGSEIWIGFNPENESDPVYQRFVATPPDNCKTVKINWNDNPWFPQELEAERLHLQRIDPERYDYVWEGGFNNSMKGAYYASHLNMLEKQNRITTVGHEPLLKVNTVWDLGMSDSTAIIFYQQHGNELRFIDYYENDGHGLKHYADVLEDKAETFGYRYERHIGPHDLAVRELGTGQSRIETAKTMGINFTVAPNLPIIEGINAVRNLLPKCWFDRDKCKKLLDAMRRYRAEYDEDKNVYKNKPLHDWTSHACDAMRYGALTVRDKLSAAGNQKPIVMQRGRIF